MKLAKTEGPDNMQATKIYTALLII